MLVLNLFAGPCAGKSILASDIYSRLKRAGIQAEVPPEIAKLHAQRGDHGFLQDQVAVFGATAHQLLMAKRSGAQVAVLDSPLLLQLVYAPKDYFKSFPFLVREVVDSYDNMNFFIRRNPDIPYSAVGRVHSEPEAVQKDEEILAMLSSHCATFSLADSSEGDAQRIAQAVVDRLRESATPSVDKPLTVRRLRAA